MSPTQDRWSRHHLTLRNPSPQVIATVGALGLESWLERLPDTGREGPQVFSGVS